MNVQFEEHHFSDELIDQFLNGEMYEDQSVHMESHLDSCEQCAQRITEIAAKPWGWNEVSRSLADDDFDANRLSQQNIESFSRNPSVDESEHQAVEGSSLLHRELSGWLDPTDDPNMLGRFAGYEIVGVIGHGGMGIVMKGFENALNRFVAIKVLAPRLASNGAARKRFEREARAAAAVLHDNVIAIHRVDQWHGLPFLVMPYVAGESLQQRIDREGPLELEATLRIAQQIAAGLAAAHSQGLVHRDIKPANILLDQGVERVTITDFGLARAADDVAITQTGFVAGTPMYMSPEQASADPIDHRSDLFSLGSVMYSMAAGVPPFQSNDNFSLLGKIREEPAPDILQKQETVPEWLAELIDWCHAKSPEDRPRSAAEIECYLSEWLAHLKQPQRVSKPARLLAPKSVQRNRRPPGIWARKLLAAFGSVLFLLAGVFITLETSKGTITIESEADNVAIVIKRGGKFYDKLTVSRGSNSIQVYSGVYLVECSGESDQVTIENGSVTLGWQGEEVVRIREGEIPITQPPSNHGAIPRNGNFGTPLPLTTWDDVKLHFESLARQREEMLHADVEFTSVASGRKGHRHRKYHVWFNGQNRRADCWGVFNNETEHFTRIITPTISWYGNHLDNSKSTYHRRNPDDWGPWDDIIDVRRIGLVNRFIEDMDPFQIDKELIPDNYANPRVEQGEHDGQPITIVRMDIESKLVDHWTEFWLSPNHDNFPIYMARGWTETDNPKEKYVTTQHTDWKKIDDVWFPTNMKLRYQCKHLNIDESAQYELSSARFSEPPPAEIFEPQQPIASKSSPLNPLPPIPSTDQNLPTDSESNKGVSDDRKTLFVRLLGDKSLLYADPTQQNRSRQKFTVEGIELKFSLERPGEEACFHIVDSNHKSIRVVVRLECSEFLTDEIWERIGDQPITLNVPYDDFRNVCDSSFYVDRVVYLPGKDGSNLLQTNTYEGQSRTVDVVEDTRKDGGQPLVSIRLDSPTAADKVATSHSRVGPKFTSCQSYSDYFDRCSDQELLRALQGEWTLTKFSFEGDKTEDYPVFVQGKPLSLVFDETSFQWNSLDMKANSPHRESFSLLLRGPGTPRLLSLVGNESFDDGLSGYAQLTPDGNLTLGLGRDPTGTFKDKGHFMITARRSEESKQPNSNGDKSQSPSQPSSSLDEELSAPLSMKEGDTVGIYVNVLLDTKVYTKTQLDQYAKTGHFIIYSLKPGTASKPDSKGNPLAAMNELVEKMRDGFFDCHLASYEKIVVADRDDSQYWRAKIFVPRTEEANKKVTQTYIDDLHDSGSEFRIAPFDSVPARTEPIWGEVVDGLQLGITGIREQEDVKFGDQLRFGLVARNVGSEPVDISYSVSEHSNWIRPKITTDTGEHVRIHALSYRGGFNSYTEQLDPQQVVTLNVVSGVRFGGDSKYQLRGAPVILNPVPGDYKLRADFGVNLLDSTDDREQVPVKLSGPTVSIRFRDSNIPADTLKPGHDATEDAEAAEFDQGISINVPLDAKLYSKELLEQYSKTGFFTLYSLIPDQNSESNKSSATLAEVRGEFEKIRDGFINCRLESYVEADVNDSNDIQYWNAKISVPMTDEFNQIISQSHIDELQASGAEFRISPLIRIPLAKPVWGEENNGLQLGITGIRDQEEVLIGNEVQYNLLVRNVSEIPVYIKYFVPEDSFWVQPSITYSAGQSHNIDTKYFRGGSKIYVEEIGPQKTVMLNVIGGISIGCPASVSRVNSSFMFPQHGEYNLQTKFAIYRIDKPNDRAEEATILKSPSLKFYVWPDNVSDSEHVPETDK